MDASVANAGGAISVVMSTYEGARFLPKQLSSILAQHRLPTEMIVCDDGSSDATVSIIEEFARTTPFPVRVSRNTTRLGPSGNFDQGMGLAQHELIAFCDQDDIWLPDRLERQAAALDRHPSATICFSDAEIIDAGSVRTGERIWARVRFRSEKEFWSADEFFSELIRHTIVTGATLMIRRSMVDLVRPIPATWLHDEWIALLSCVHGFDALVISEPLIEYRVHNQQHTGIRNAKLDLQALRAVNRPISREVERSQTLVERIERRAPREARRLSAVHRRHRHLVERADLARFNPVRRLARIIRELATGNYRRFSNGWSSAVADLAGRTRD